MGKSGRCLRKVSVAAFLFKAKHIFSFSLILIEVSPISGENGGYHESYQKFTEVSK